MLEQVDILNEHGEELSLPLSEFSSGIILRGIQGLDPVKANLVSSEFAMMDGTLFQAARRESRNIILQMGLDSRYGGLSNTEIRHELYRVFMPKTQARLTFSQTTKPPVEITGHVEVVSAPIFTKEPTFGVSILCNDPDFINPVPDTFSGEGYPSGMVMRDVDYAGTVASGVEIEVSMNNSATGQGFEVRQTTPRGDNRSLIFQTPLLGGDDVIIKTHPGQKEVLVRRNGSETSIIYGVDPQSEWPMFEPGLNKLGVRVTGDTEQSFYEVFWHDRYGGL